MWAGLMAGSHPLPFLILIGSVALACSERERERDGEHVSQIKNQLFFFSGGSIMFPIALK